MNEDYINYGNSSIYQCFLGFVYVRIINSERAPKRGAGGSNPLMEAHM